VRCTYTACCIRPSMVNCFFAAVLCRFVPALRHSLTVLNYILFIYVAFCSIVLSMKNTVVCWLWLLVATASVYENLWLWSVPRLLAQTKSRACEWIFARPRHHGASALDCLFCYDFYCCFHHKKITFIWYRQNVVTRMLPWFYVNLIITTTCL